MKSADVEGHIVESAELDDARAIEGIIQYSSNVGTLHSLITIAGDWRTEFEELIAKYSSQTPPQLARTVCEHMYTKYPDITWVVIVYAPITGGDKHSVLANSQTHFVFRHHGHNAIISRYAGDVITSDFGLETSLYSSFTPSCYRYCHDPACWNKYYHVDADRTVMDTWPKLSNSNWPFMLFTLQAHYGNYNYAGRRDSSTGVINGGPVVGTNLWDTRVVEAQIKTTCDDKYAKMMLLGVKKG